MREIKYKYVFKHSKDGDIQTEVFGIDDIEKYPLYHNERISDYFEDDGYKLIGRVQYTGLKDINGVEVYEGDKVKHLEGINYIEYDEDSAMYVLDCYSGKPLHHNMPFVIIGDIHPS